MQVHLKDTDQLQLGERILIDFKQSVMLYAQEVEQIDFDKLFKDLIGDNNV